MIKTPTYWAERGWRAVLLLPLSVLWAIGSLVRDSLARPARATVPVVCIGNLGAGGTGKTPIVSWLYDNLASRGWQPVILSRGYGGQLRGPVWVDSTVHTADDCGDEPLMTGKPAATGSIGL